MKRGRHDYLTGDEVIELRRMYARGIGIPEIATRFNMSERCVGTRTADMRSGGRRIAMAVIAEVADLCADARHLARPICLVEGCIAPLSTASRFCDAHEPKPRPALTGSTIPPPSMARLMGGR